MAGMLKKVAGRCRQNVKKECRLNFDGIAVRRTYGSRARSHIKTVGLMTCYQIQQQNRTGRSLTDRPELLGSCSREKSSGATLCRDVGDACSFNLSSSYGHFHKAVTLSTEKEALSKRNCSTSESDCIKNQCLHRSKLNLFDSRDIHDVDEAANVDKAQGHTRSLASHIGFGIVNMNSRVSLRSAGFDDVHLSLPSLANSFSHHVNTRRTSNIKNGGILARQYATRAQSRRPAKQQKNYYEELGITPHATQAQVKSAYFNLSKIYHPDKSSHKDSHSRFAAINEAYSVLGNLTLRKRYDRGTLSQKDIHGDVSKEEKAHEHHHPHHHHAGGATNTSAGIPFSEEAKRQAKKMDDFFSEHYKNALEKERRDKIDRKQRLEEYMEMQEKAKITPLVLALFMLLSVTLAVKSVTSNSILDKKLTRKES